MADDHNYREETAAMIVDREDMDELIRTGHAQPWTQELGSGGFVWTAARIQYVMFDERGYRPAAGPLAAALNAAQDLFTLPATSAQQINEAVDQVRRAAASTSPAPAFDHDVIDRQSMGGHLESGVAQPWTRDLGPGGLPMAARLWFYVAEGEDVYQPAPGPLAALLDSGHASLDEADRQAALLVGEGTAGHARPT